MSNFLTSIHINKIFHLENFEIPIDENEKKHLIITGKNGSGKTSLLNALVEFFQRIQQDKALNFLGFEKNLELCQEMLSNSKKLNSSENEIRQAENNVLHFEKGLKATYGKLIPSLNHLEDISRKVQNGEFLFAFYAANRKTQVTIPKNPEKPNLELSGKVTDSKQGEFVKFLVDLKIQEALARNENQISDANKIKEWFDNFEQLLSEIFEGSKVTLNFNYKDYSFTINQDGREFGFNELSDGYSAIIDIIADLILKMQTPNSLTRAYEKEGIVLIDEIETHLHLELQRLILPMLTRVFPNIQFIVTTHSPFVLSSIPNAVAYDLEKKQRLEDLTEYSYEALAEGYFKVKTESNFLQAKLDRFKELAEKAEKDTAEKAEYESLDKEFRELDETLAPQHVIGSYRQIKLAAQ
jgi:predicted ATP-binding protein involved in virulence